MASDGVFPTFGTIAPVPEYLRAAERYDGCVWLDDCHGIGVLGPNGRGTSEHSGLTSERVFFGGTTSKAIGAHGGIIPGSAELVRLIREGHVVSGSNAPSSAAAAAAVTGMTLMMAHPELRARLGENARRLKSGLARLGFPQEDSPVPVAAWALPAAADMDRVHAELMRRDIAIQRTHYISGGADGLLRAVVFATHEPAEIDRLLTELKAVL